MSMYSITQGSQLHKQIPTDNSNNVKINYTKLLLMHAFGVARHQMLVFQDLLCRFTRTFKLQQQSVGNCQQGTCKTHPLRKSHTLQLSVASCD